MYIGGPGSGKITHCEHLTRNFTVAINQPITKLNN